MSTLPRSARGPRPPLPGSCSLEASGIEAMIRVDHAGEFGALRIYAGQLAILSKKRGAEIATDSIRHMESQEQVHFDAFEQLIKNRSVRPTALQPLWSVAGYALGAATALMGEKAAMACTVAVEDVIDAHYAHQIERLGEQEPELKRTIETFRQDECAHRDEALKQGAKETPAYPLLSAAIRAGCRAAIKLSERL